MWTESCETLNAYEAIGDNNYGFLNFWRKTWIAKMLRAMVEKHKCR